MRRARFALGLAIVALCAAATSARAQPSPERASMPVARLHDGRSSFSSYSGITDSLRAVVRDSANWRVLWARINRPFIPQPALPAIDFRREMIVVAALGARSSGGYDVMIETVDQDAEGIEVAVRRVSPAPGCPVEAVVTQPLDLARIPASTQPVRFRERSVVIPCGSR